MAAHMKTVDGLLVSLYLFVSFLFLRGPHAGEARVVAWANFTCKRASARLALSSARQQDVPAVADGSICLL
jgi:hypothetical protein